MKRAYELQYETKLQQAIGYKELLGNILPKEVDIGTYMFLVEAEEDKWGGATYVDDTEKLPNQDKMKDLARYIERFFKKNKNFAADALLRISNEIDE